MTEIKHDLLQPEMPPTRWGDPALAGPLPDGVRDLVGLVFPLSDTPAAADVAVPAPHLAAELIDGLRVVVGDEHVVLDDALRRQRTRGKSTPDLLRQRAGDLSDAPDVVVRPADHDDVQAVLGYAAEHRIVVVPFGGGTAVAGGLAPDREGFAGVISLDLGRMRSLLALDPVSSTATLGPGLRGPEAEALLAEHGLMLGHFRRASSSRPSAASPRPGRAASPARATAGSTRWSSACAPPPRRARSGSAARHRPTRPARPARVSSLRGRVRRHHQGHRPGAAVPKVKEYEGWQWSSSPPEPTRCARSRRAT